MPYNDLLTIQQVADRLGLSHKTVVRRIDDGTIPVVRIGRLVRIRPEDLDRLAMPAVRPETVVS